MAEIIPLLAMVKLANSGGFSGHAFKSDYSPDLIAGLSAEATINHAAQEPVEATDAVATGAWRFGLHDPVADATLPPITYRDKLKLWPDSPGKTVTQVIAGPKEHKTNWIMAELFRLAMAGTHHDR